jgi:hypothetical protein
MPHMSIWREEIFGPVRWWLPLRSMHIRSGKASGVVRPCRCCLCAASAPRSRLFVRRTTPRTAWVRDAAFYTECGLYARRPCLCVCGLLVWFVYACVCVCSCCGVHIGRGPNGSHYASDGDRHRVAKLWPAVLCPAPVVRMLSARWWVVASCRTLMSCLRLACQGRSQGVWYRSRQWRGGLLRVPGAEASRDVRQARAVGLVQHCVQAVEARGRLELRVTCSTRMNAAHSQRAVVPTQLSWHLRRPHRQTRRIHQPRGAGRDVRGTASAS